MFEGRYYLRTFGCQMNEVDSEQAAETLETLGYHRTYEPEEADLLLVNTCSVRDKAEHKAYSMAGRFDQIKRNKPQVKIGVMGCVPEMPGQQFGKFKGIDFVIGAKEKDQQGKRLDALGVDRDTFSLKGLSENQGLSLGLTVVRGCSYYCTFCIVPAVRGHEDSIPLEELLSQVRRAADRGVKEITLLGQNVLWYGKDLKTTNFLDLIEKVCEVPGVERVRFLTSHPNDLKEDLVAFVAQHPKCYKAFHLPIQSGSETLLKAMNRRGSAAQYREKVSMIRHYWPDSAISTDLIAGFPGETEQDHQDTMDLMREVAWDGAYIFGYSPRIGTPAAKRPPGEEVPAAVSKQRVQELLALQGEVTLRKHQEDLGKRLSVFVSKKEEDGRCVGHADNYRKIVFQSEEDVLGTTQVLHVQQAKPWGLAGELEPVAG